MKSPLHRTGLRRIPLTSKDINGPTRCDVGPGGLSSHPSGNLSRIAPAFRSGSKLRRIRLGPVSRDQPCRTPPRSAAAQAWTARITLI